LVLISTYAPTEENDEVATEEFVGLWERYVIQFPTRQENSTRAFQCQSLKKSPIYIQHVEGTAFTTKQIMMENEW